jgi:hypothetical protein
VKLREYAETLQLVITTLGDISRLRLPIAAPPVFPPTLGLNGTGQARRGLSFSTALNV